MGSLSLPRGFRLGGNKYIIEGVLGQGGFGITYLAQNVNTRKNYAIKEFFPKEYCGRDESTMHVITHLDTDFIERFKRKFIKEAGIMMSFHHPNIVSSSNNRQHPVMWGSFDDNFIMMNWKK